MSSGKSKHKDAAAGAMLAIVGVTLTAHPSYAACTPTTPCTSSPTNLGTLGNIQSSASGVSADGSVAVGFTDVSGGTNHAFRWTASGGMVDLGTLGGSVSESDGVNADGSVVVGGSGTAGNAAFHAFRWTSTTGMVDLGTLGGTHSEASSVSSDGSVIVGESSLASGLFFHAFRWTTTSGMTDLGTLPGAVISSATGVSADGSVVVGFSGNLASHAFRWTGGTMTDLGTLGGSSSAANGVSANGSVVVGQSDVTGNATQHAFRWTGGAGMVDLGTLSGGRSSFAASANADGSIVVGASSVGGSQDHAFRWTANGGIKDLNTLLAGAGVNMAGITLVNAIAISANGQFIVGDGVFAGSDRGYVVRYDDGSGAAGLTTQAAVQQSVNGFGKSQFGLMAQQHGMAAPLLGANTAMNLGSEAGGFVAAGSAEGGVFARYNTDKGLSFLGGVSWAQESYPSADLHNSFLAAAAVQYVYDSGNWWHPFVEGGAWIAPDSSLSFTRTYANGVGTTNGIGSTRGDLSYYYGRAGLLLAWQTARQVALSAEFGRERLGLNGYAEQLSSNPFNAVISGGTDQMDVAKLRLQGSWRFGERYDASVWAAAVHGFDRTTDLVVAVVAFGPFRVTDLHELNWAEFGARLGVRVSQNTTLDVFANGVSGESGINTRVHVGAGARVSF